MVTCNAEIPPIDAFVQETFLFDNDPSKTGVVPCKIFGVSSYPDCAPTFSIHIPENGACFAYIPFHAVTKVEKPDYTFTHKQLVCGNCQGEDISVTSYEYLKQLVWVQLRGETTSWCPGTYLFTIDWYKQNELFHVIELMNGQFAAQPHHRCLFGVNSAELPPYKKLHSEWKV